MPEESVINNQSSILMVSQKVPEAVIARSEATKQSPIFSYLPRWGLLRFARNDGFFNFLRNHQFLITHY